MNQTDWRKSHDFDLETAVRWPARVRASPRKARERRPGPPPPHRQSDAEAPGGAREREGVGDGAAGEEALGAYLAKRCPGVIVLNDRRMPRSKANIDHLAIAPTGILVIDAKRYKGKIEVRKPIFGDEKLLNGGRNKANLLKSDRDKRDRHQGDDNRRSGRTPQSSPQLQQHRYDHPRDRTFGRNSARQVELEPAPPTRQTPRLAELSAGVRSGWLGSRFTSPPIAKAPCSSGSNHATDRLESRPSPRRRGS